MKPKTMPALTPKDIPILNFIWWWKFASTAAIIGRFWPDYHWRAPTAHWRLNRLRRKGYLTLLHAHHTLGGYWTLTQQGFKVIEPSLSKLKEKGFATENLNHDLWVQVAHLGDWLPRYSAPDVRFFTEQELRRVDPDCYPDWVPTSTGHRPDGYWNLPSSNGRRVVALEVEISIKSFDDYKAIANFYNHEPSIESVLWFIQYDSILSKVEKAVNESPFGRRRIHHFVRLSDLQKNGWDSIIYHGAFRDRKVSEFLNMHRSVKPPCNPHETPVHAWSQAISDSTLFRVKSSTFGFSETSKNPDCIPPQAQNQCP